MVPTSIIALPALPQGSSGKVDFDALREPHTTSTSTTPSQYLPRSGLQIELALLWQDVLEIETVGVHDNFFEVGGDSLAAITFLTGLEAIINDRASISLSFLIHHPTIAELALALTKLIGTHPLAVPLSTHENAPTLYLAASGHGDAIRFHRLAVALGDACSIQMLQPPFADSKDEPPTFTQLANHYADLIQSREDGDIYLGGFSIGGIAALETARVLGARGLPPKATLLLDTLFPIQAINSGKIWAIFIKMVKRLKLGNWTLNGRKIADMLSDQGLSWQLAALETYAIKPYAGPVELCISSGSRRLSFLLFRPWRKCLTDLHISHTIGFHGSIFMPSHIAHLAAMLRHRLTFPK
jgi:thioesterase domain-containing protein